MHRRALLLALSVISSAIVLDRDDAVIVDLGAAAIDDGVIDLNRGLQSERHLLLAVPNAPLPYRAGHQVVRAARYPVLTGHPPHGHV
jgi:hypothetical protein